MRNEEFICEYCETLNEPHPTGSARNHCKKCLCSKHLDKDFPGDRQSECGGKMEAYNIDYRKNKGYMIVHKCNKCGKEIANQVAPDDDFLTFVKKRNERK